MTTKDLIDAAISADAMKETTAAMLVEAQQSDVSSDNAKAQAHKDLHDDLVASGPAAVVHTTAILVYRPIEPVDFAVDTVRLA